MKKPPRNYRKTLFMALVTIATCVLCSLFLWKVIEGSLNHRGNVKTYSESLPASKPKACERPWGGSGECDCAGNCLCELGRSEPCPGCVKK